MEVQGPEVSSRHIFFWNKQLCDSKTKSLVIRILLSNEKDISWQITVFPQGVLYSSSIYNNYMSRTGQCIFSINDFQQRNENLSCFLEVDLTGE